MTLPVHPRAEVHVHLEGCFERNDLVELAALAGTPLPRPAESLFAFSTFDDFLRFLTWSCGLVGTRELLARAAYRYAERAAVSGVVRADMIVNPTHWGAWRGDLDGFVDALDAGWKQAESDGLPSVGLCLSIERTQSASEAAGLVDWMISRRPARVVGLSVDGNETRAGRTGPRFAESFRRAGAAGFGITVHAGETSGPEGVWDAIDLLGADRIDHGVRAVEDPALVETLALRGIPLGVCPSSNVTLGIVPSWEEHPIERLRQAGVRVSVNTDDPGFLGVDLAGEYERCTNAFGWTDDTVREVCETSLAACFQGADR